MQTVYDRIGMSGCEYTFNEDGTYSYTLKKRTMSGTYTIYDKEKTITPNFRSEEHTSLILPSNKRDVPKVYVCVWLCLPFWLMPMLKI